MTNWSVINNNEKKEDLINSNATYIMKFIHLKFIN